MWITIRVVVTGDGDLTLDFTPVVFYLFLIWFNLFYKFPAAILLLYQTKFLSQKMFLLFRYNGKIWLQNIIQRNVESLFCL